MNYLEVFVFLQLLDFLTTLVGLRLGAGEANPLVAMAMRSHGPMLGLVIVKGLALVWGAVCIIRKKPLAIQIVNYMFAGLVLWNLAIILRVLQVVA